MRRWNIGEFLSDRLGSVGPLTIHYDLVEEFAWRLRFKGANTYFLGFLHFASDSEVKETETIVIASVRVGRMMPLNTRGWLDRQVEKYERDGQHPLSVMEEHSKLNLLSALQIVMSDATVADILDGSTEAADELLSTATKVFTLLLKDYNAGHALADQYRQMN